MRNVKFYVKILVDNQWLLLSEPHETAEIASCVAVNESLLRDDDGWAIHEE